MPYFGVPIRNGVPIGLGSIAGFGISPFDPSQLFAGGEQGGLYDFSDLSVMFQDAAGTTPVTAVEQPVGLVLDKSKGLALGSEINTSPTTWTAAAGWTNNNDGSYTGTNDNSIYKIIGGVTTSTYYEVTLTISSYTSGSVVVVLRGNSRTVGSGNGTKTVRLFSGTSGDNNVYIGGSGSFNGIISNISIKQVTGNHLSQSTSTARPVLSARVNLLTYTEQFDNAAWTAIGTKTVSQSGSDWVVTDNSASVFQGIEQTGIAVISGATYKGTLKVKKTTGTPSNYPVYQIGLNNIDNSYSGVIIDTTNGTLVTLTGGYYSAPAATSIEPSGDYWLVSLSVTMSSTATRVQIYPAASANGTTTTATATGSITIREPDLRPANAGVGLPSYQRVTTSTDYDTTGFPLYLKFDGTDDSLSSGSIDFTSTDKMSVFAGVRKISDAAGAILVELSSGVSSNSGSFYISAPDDVGAPNYGIRTRGSTGIPGINYATYAAPVTNVLATSLDNGGASGLPANCISTRINGAFNAGSSNGATGSGGNFGNHPLYVGRRGGTTAPANMHLYSLIVRGALTDAATIASTETWVNGKTLAY